MSFTCVPPPLPDIATLALDTTEFVTESQLASIALGLNIEGDRAARTCSSSQQYCGIWQILDVPLGVSCLEPDGSLFTAPPVTFNDVLARRDGIKRVRGIYPGLLEATVGIDCCTLIDQTTNFIAAVIRSGDYRTPLVHLHQYREWTALDSYISAVLVDEDVPMPKFITDGTNLAEAPVNYAFDYPEHDVIIALGQIAGFGSLRIGEWIIPSELAAFDVTRCTITTPFREFGVTNGTAGVLASNPDIGIKATEGRLLVVNGLWNPSSDPSQRKIVFINS